MTLGLVMKRRRQELDLSCEQVGSRLGWIDQHGGNVSALERGVHDPTWPVVLRWLIAVEWTLLDLAIALQFAEDRERSGVVPVTEVPSQRTQERSVTHAPVMERVDEREEKV